MDLPTPQPLQNTESSPAPTEAAMPCTELTFKAVQTPTRDSSSIARLEGPFQTAGPRPRGPDPVTEGGRPASPARSEGCRVGSVVVLQLPLQNRLGGAPGSPAGRTLPTPSWTCQDACFQSTRPRLGSRVTLTGPHGQRHVTSALQPRPVLETLPRGPPRFRVPVCLMHLCVLSALGPQPS